MKSWAGKGDWALLLKNSVFLKPFEYSLQKEIFLWLILEPMFFSFAKLELCG